MAQVVECMLSNLKSRSSNPYLLLPPPKMVRDLPWLRNSNPEGSAHYQLVCGKSSQKTCGICYSLCLLVVLRGLSEFEQI
jgi:hypothetical protein